VRQCLLSEGAGFITQRDTLEARQKEVEKQLKETHEAIRDLAANLLPFAVAPRWCLRLHERLQQEAAAEQTHLTYEAQHDQAAAVATSLLDAQFQAQTAPAVSSQDWAQIASAVQALLQPAEAGTALDIRHSLSHQDRDTLAAWIARATDQVPQQMHTLAQQLEQLETEQTDLEQKVRQVPDAAVANPLIEEFQRLSHEKGRLEEQHTRIEEELKQTQYQLDQLDRERSAAWKRLADAGDTDARVDRAAKARVILEEYQQQITDTKLHELERAVAEYFNLLCRKQMLVREVKIDRQRFTVTLYGANRTVLPKSDLSAGEKQLYAIALLWALRSVSGRALPIIVDTPMGRLDSSHRETMLTHFLPHAAHQVLLLATDTEIDSQAYELLQPAISHSFRLEYRQEQGSTQVVRGDDTEQLREVAV
jgi:DNA sulfur modification protein DndD